MKALSAKVTMMLDILLTNREPVRRALSAYQARLERLGSLLDVGDEAGLRQFLQAARDIRREVTP